jgi:non-heme chloroperoxidase
VGDRGRKPSSGAEKVKSVRTFVVGIVVCGAAIAWSQPVEWKDRSPHAASLIPVDDDVQLEVLDWGGSGPAIVLLAGLGDTSHVFDDFAPMLIPRYRVLGVTRRGHGRSSAPPTGYGFERLAEDVVRVIDATGVKRPVIAGHSIAGEELHVLGARHSAKVAGLIYLDAAFNRADGSEDYDAVARTLPPAPRPGPGDLASFAALRSFLERTQGLAGPEAHLRARYVANADGSIARSWAPAPPIFQAISREMQAAFKSYNPERIRVPALAVYVVPKSVNDLMQRWYNVDDPAVQEAVKTLHRLAHERFARHAKWFEAFAERGRVTQLSGAHHLFISHPREVLQQIDGFMSSIATTP